jgi:hypothetical protein
MPHEFITRREVLAASAAMGASAILARAQTPTSPNPRPRATIGMATSVAPLARGEVGPILDDMQSRAGVNAIFPFIYSHIPNRAGLPGNVQTFHGGNFAIPHMQYYKDQPLTYEDMRAPEFGDVDVLAKLIPEAKKRGIKTFAWMIEDNARPLSIANWEKLYEIDFKGQRTTRHPSGPCNNNPMYRNYLFGLVEDYCRSYEIDGVMWGSERQGGLLNALGAYHNGQNADPGQATCFCEFCVKKGKDKGIDVERARAGFGELEKYVRNGRARQRPSDGFFVSFWRILLQYPELLAWENLWVTSRHEMQAEMYKLVKSIKPDLPVGWHMWHNLIFNPFHRAEEDYSKMTAYSDYIKPVLYNNCAGERIRSYLDSTRANAWGDLPPAQGMEFLYKVMNYDEAPYDRVAAAGFSPAFVEREARRNVEAVAGSKTEIWPGIDIDAPTGANSSKSTPESVKQSILACFKGGATGVMISRNYVEMKPENLSGAGAALKELGIM